jgi:hypothetical protein
MQSITFSTTLASATPLNKVDKAYICLTNIDDSKISREVDYVICGSEKVSLNKQSFFSIDPVSLYLEYDQYQTPTSEE